MFLFRRKKKDDEPVDPNERSPELGIRFKDLQVLGAMMDDGADLSDPRHVVYYLYFPSSVAAEQAAETSRDAGYQCRVAEPIEDSPAQWSVQCERPDAVLAPRTVIDADNLFQGIADRLGGEFDGWEAEANRG